jgi:predicted DCC family thiol-disulfide oxidoreductase YuxK
MKKSLVIYDGDCGICEKFRHLLEKLDWLKRFSCHPLTDHKIYNEYNVTPEECELEIKLISPSSQIYGGADAMLKIMLNLPLLAPMGWVLWVFPFRFILIWLYPFIANNRYRISSTCGLDEVDKSSSDDTQ